MVTPATATSSSSMACTGAAFAGVTALLIVEKHKNVGILFTFRSVLAFVLLLC
jgi:hypothetical protein